jgi:hypothetical protein
MYLSPKQIALWLMGASLLAGCSINMSTVLPPATATIELPTVTQSPTATSLPTPASTATSTSVIAISVQTGTDRATFIKETYPDYSSIAPGEKFTKTWDVKNIGSSTWNRNYKLVIDATPQNDSLGSTAEVNLAQDVLPGETVTLSIPLIAPTRSGTYSVYWKLQNDHGETFGVDGDRVWVTIMVCEAGTPCASPSSSYGASSANGVSATLTNVTPGAQSTTVAFCMTLPSIYYDLGYPSPTLIVDQQTFNLLSGTSTNPHGCYEFEYALGAAEFNRAKRIVLSIDNVRVSPARYPDEDCQSARPRLIVQYRGLDFQCNFSMSGYYTNLQFPTGMTREQAQQIIMDAVEGAIYGPWTLTIR